MARIKIEDLKEDMKISQEETTKICGGDMQGRTAIRGVRDASRPERMSLQPPPRSTPPGGTVANPLVIGGAVATAVAVPIPIHKSDDD